MSFFFLIFIILFFLHREILSLTIRYVSRAELLPSGPWDLRLKAQNSAPVVYLTKLGLLETISFRTWVSHLVFVSEELWNEWTDLEREAYLVWALSAHRRSSTLERLIFRSRVATLDRDATFFFEPSLDFTNVYKKTIRFRETHHLTIFGSLLSGLSLLGPCLLSDWPSHDERLKRIASYLADWQKPK